MSLLNSVMWRLSREKQGLSEKLLRLADTYRSYYYDFGYDFEVNGEKRVMQRLASHGFRQIFDVGANVGEWSILASTHFPGATFHAFELSPPTFVKLQANLTDPKFIANDFGLGAYNQEIEFKDYGPDHSTLNTLVATAFHDDRLPYDMHRSRIVTGDSYMVDRGLSTIDFLKIDVEGAEHLVLEGFAGALERQAIRVIQFEYGYANGDAKFLMRDFYRVLEGFGYTLGKIWSTGVDFTPFNYRMNDFDSGPNYLAVRRSDEALINDVRMQRT